MARAFGRRPRWPTPPGGSPAPSSPRRAAPSLKSLPPVSPQHELTPEKQPTFPPRVVALKGSLLRPQSPQPKSRPFPARQDPIPRPDRPPIKKGTQPPPQPIQPGQTRADAFPPQHELTPEKQPTFPPQVVPWRGRHPPTSLLLCPPGPTLLHPDRPPGKKARSHPQPPRPEHSPFLPAPTGRSPLPFCLRRGNQKRPLASARETCPTAPLPPRPSTRGNRRRAVPLSQAKKGKALPSPFHLYPPFKQRRRTAPPPGPGQVTTLPPPRPRPAAVPPRRSPPPRGRQTPAAPCPRRSAPAPSSSGRPGRPAPAGPGRGG